MATTLSSTTAPTRFQLDVTRSSPARMLVTVAGDIDLATAPELGDRLLSVLREHAPAILDVDLAGVAFLDCAGISALITARNAAVSAGSQLWIVHPQPFVRRVLDVTGLLGVLTAPVDPPRRSGPRHRLFNRPRPRDGI